MKKFYQLNQETIKQIKKFKGPILIFGVGGFIGFNGNRV